MQAFPQRLIIGGEEQWIAAHLAASGWLLCYAEELIGAIILRPAAMPASAGDGRLATRSGSHGFGGRFTRRSGALRESSPARVKPT